MKTVFTQAFHLAGVQSVSLDLAIFLVICMYTTFVLSNCDIQENRFGTVSISSLVLTETLLTNNHYPKHLNYQKRALCFYTFERVIRREGKEGNRA